MRKCVMVLGFLLGCSVQPIGELQVVRPPDQESLIVRDTTQHFQFSCKPKVKSSLECTTLGFVMPSSLVFSVLASVNSENTFLQLGACTPTILASLYFLKKARGWWQADDGIGGPVSECVGYTVGFFSSWAFLCLLYPLDSFDVSDYESVST